MSTIPLESGGLRLRSAPGRWVVLATVLGSTIALIDGTVVNVALPTIGREFHSGIATLQWTVTAYTLTLAAFILIGGSLGDRFGRRRIFLTGVTWFATASLLCGLAPSATVLIVARALQGVGGALLTPGSLAILQATFRPEDRAAAIGLWSGLGGVGAAIGPFVGGYLIQAVSWRLIFLINLPLVLVVILVSRRHVPETRGPRRPGRLDVPGAALAALGLGALIYGLIEGPEKGWSSAGVLVALAGGAVVLAAFVLAEWREREPMLPLAIFRARQFNGANLVTFLVYGALGGSLFLVPIELQQAMGYSPLLAGIALLPITLIMLTLSARAGRLSQRIGPRLPMTVGPICAGAGLALLSRMMPGQSYWTGFLPGIVVFSLGLATTVAPLTATVLAAAPVEHAGLASAVNNAVARAAGLIAVAALPAAAGITGISYLHGAAFASGFRMAMFIGGALCAFGGLVALATIRRGGATRARREDEFSCPLDAPPLRPDLAPAHSPSRARRVVGEDRPAA